MHLYRLEVNMDHLQTFNSTLHDLLRDKPAEIMPNFELAAKKVSLFPGPSYLLSLSAPSYIPLVL